MMKRFSNLIWMIGLVLATALVCRWMWQDEGTDGSSTDRSSRSVDRTDYFAANDELAQFLPAAFSLAGEDVILAHMSEDEAHSPRQSHRRPATGMTWTEEEIDLAIEVAHEVDQKLAERLERSRRENPRELRRRLNESTRLKNLVILKQNDSVLYDLKRMELRTDLEVHQLARALQRAKLSGESAAEIESLETELRLWVRMEFVLQYKWRDDYLCRLLDNVVMLQKQLEATRSKFDELVEQRMQELQDGNDASPPTQMMYRTREG